MLLWLLIGVIAAFQRGYFQGSEATCARTSTILVTVLGGPLNPPHEGEPFWQALREGRRPSNSGSAPALAGDYAALAHEVLTRISALEAAVEPAGAPA